MIDHESHRLRRWYSMVLCASVMAASGAGLLTGCRPPAAPEPTPAAQTTSPDPSGSPDGFSLEPPGHYCRDWLRTLRPVNHTELDYVARNGLWDGTAPAFGGLESCDVQMRDAPAAAEAGLDFVWVKLTITGDPNRIPRGHTVPDLPEPAAEAVDWKAYLEDEDHTVLRGELACEPIWTSENGYITDPELAECDTGGTIDGQAFTYQFAATHRDVFLAASIDYLTTDLSQQIETTARSHAIDLFAAFATAVASALPGE